MTTPSARARERLNHPVVDADGHWREVQPVFLEYVAEVAGSRIADAYRKAASERYGFGWYAASAQERARARMTRPPWWTSPVNALERATSMVPKLFNDRMDEFGIDFALLYPSLGFNLARVEDEEMRRGLVRAYNVMVADMFRPYSRRIAASGVIAMNTPAEAMEEADYAVRTLGLKLLVANCTVARETEADGASPSGRRRTYIDGLGLDSPYDYDPVWQKMIDLKVAVTSHVGSMGWPDRTSTNSFVANHLGHFAQSHHLFARSLFMGGVTERFPQLNFGFLEGGVGWACQLYADIYGHWAKRNRQAMERNLRPSNLDTVEVRRLMKLHADPGSRLAAKIDDVLAGNLDQLVPDITQEELTRRDELSDEFMHVAIRGKDDIRRRFADRFYFGCEADDPITALAFQEKTGTRLKAMMGSDISHFDVPDPTAVLEEAWELVDHGLLDEGNFREFTFANAVRLHGEMNPQFFAGTVIEDEARAELAGRPAP